MLHQYRQGALVMWHGLHTATTKRAIAAKRLYASGGEAAAQHDGCEVLFKIYSKGCARDVSEMSEDPQEHEAWLMSASFLVVQILPANEAAMRDSADEKLLREWQIDAQRFAPSPLSMAEAREAKALVVVLEEYVGEKGRNEGWADNAGLTSMSDYADIMPQAVGG
jgi:hypothetical protein